MYTISGNISIHKQLESILFVTILMKLSVCNSFNVFVSFVTHPSDRSCYHRCYRFSQLFQVYWIICKCKFLSLSSKLCFIFNVFLHFYRVFIYRPKYELRPKLPATPIKRTTLSQFQSNIRLAYNTDDILSTCPNALGCNIHAIMP